jgi:hypothetical protein
MTPSYMEAFETLKIRLISVSCLVLPEVSSDATLPKHTYASSLRIACVLLQDHGGNLQPFTYMARKLNSAKRGNFYSAYDLKALAVGEVVKYFMCCLETCSKFMVVSDHDTLRYMLWKPNDRLNKRHARYVRDLQPFTGAMTSPSQGFKERG